MFEITNDQFNRLGQFLTNKVPDSITVHFDQGRITFSMTTITAIRKREEEITIYANGATKIEKSENINSGENTAKPFEKDEFY